MKIVLLAPDVSLNKVSGGSTHHKGVCKYLAKENEVILIGHGHEKIEEGSYETRTYPWIKNPLRGGSKPVKKIDKIIKEIGPGVVYYRAEPFEAFGLKTKIKKPIITEINYNFFTPLDGIWGNFWFLRNWILKKWFLKLAEKTEKFVCVSQYVKERLNKRNIPKRKIAIPNGADLDLFKPKTKNGKIIFVGGAGKHQGVDLLIKAMKDVNCKLDIFGGFDPNKEFINKLKQKASNSSNIEFKGKISREKIAKLMGEYSIGVAPYRDKKEGYGFSPIKLFEYMASGLAVIASNTAWNGEIIKNKKNGLLFKEGSPKDLKSKIKLVLDNTVLKNKLQKEARKSSENFYNWERAAKNIGKVCSDAI